MAKRELIYKDEARRAVLQNAAGIIWCIDSIKPVAVVEDKNTKVAVKQDEYWIARVEYWPARGKETTVVLIYYVWADGSVDFIPFGDESPVRSTQCAQFELLERIEMEKYK